MQRRTVLRGLAALATGAAAAGCSSNREVPATAPDVPVTDDRGGGPGPGGRSGGTDVDDGIVVPGSDGKVITVGENASTTPGEDGTDSATTDGPGTGTDTKTVFTTTTPRPVVPDGFDLHEGDDGNLVIAVRVENTTDREMTARAFATIEFEGETREEAAFVDLAADESATVRIEFPVDYAAFMGSPSASAGAEPATPTASESTATPGSGSTATPGSGSTATPADDGTATND